MLKTFIIGAVLALGPLATGEDDHGGAHAWRETETIRASRLAQSRAAETHEFVGDGCPFASWIRHHPPSRKVALTFDDGPSGDITPWLMDRLDERKIRGTFFLVGSRLDKYAALAQEVRRRGHLVGNHSWEHPNFHRIDQDKQFASITTTDAALGQLLQPLKLFRYPYGNASCPSKWLLKGLGYRIVGWHVDSCDWAYDRTGTVGDVDAKICEILPTDRSAFVDHVVHAVKERGGGILLMHEIHRHTIRQLPRIIDALLREGFTFTNLDDPELRADL